MGDDPSPEVPRPPLAAREQGSRDPHVAAAAHPREGTGSVAEVVSRLTLRYSPRRHPYRRRKAVSGIDDVGPYTHNGDDRLLAELGLKTEGWVKHDWTDLGTVVVEEEDDEKSPTRPAAE